jgi:hypothetical protein
LTSSQPFTAFSDNRCFLKNEPRLSLIAALARFKVKASDLMIQATKQDDARAGISDHFRCLLKDALTNTHFFISGLDAPCRTTRGTRPGDPLGDLLYNMVMALIMRDARGSMLQMTNAEWIGGPTPCADFPAFEELPRVAFLDLAFVDDCAVATHAPDNDQVMHMVQCSVHSMAVASR